MLTSQRRSLTNKIPKEMTQQAGWFATAPPASVRVDQETQWIRARLFPTHSAAKSSCDAFLF